MLFSLVLENTAKICYCLDFDILDGADQKTVYSVRIIMFQHFTFEEYQEKSLFPVTALLILQNGSREEK